MTIVASEDGRNAAWASDKSGFGHKMLAKMGWSEGKGLGKNKQGQTHNLRAIRREESLGIGASTDTHGSEGFSQTSANFHGVLAKLNAEHGSGSSSGASSDEDSGSASGRNSSKKSKKEKKKKKSKSSKKAKKAEKKTKHRGKRDKDNKITLAQNRVAAGHARKMRDAKDLSSKSAADMAAIFGVKVEHYRPPAAIAAVGGTSSSSDDAASKKNKKKQKKKAKSKDKKKSSSS